MMLYCVNWSRIQIQQEKVHLCQHLQGHGKEEWQLLFLQALYYFLKTLPRSFHKRRPYNCLKLGQWQQ